jgi:hypothetical protein
MYGQKDFLGWDDSKKLRVIRALREIIAERSVQGYGIAINKKDYNDIVQGDIRKKMGDRHYTWAVRTVIGMIENWRQNKQIIEPMEYIFDRMSEGRGEIVKVFVDAESTGNALHRYGIYKGCHSFRDKAEILPLQAADLVAWLVYQRGMNDAVSRQPHNITRETFNYFNRHNFLCATYSRKHLAELVEKETAAMESAASVVVKPTVKGMRYPK